MNANQKWEFEGVRDLLVACVGYNFGPNPETRLDDIRRDREALGQLISHRMRLSKDDVVMDLGSGCGFVSRAVAPECALLFCVDISPDFNRYCKQELEHLPNVKFHLLPRNFDLTLVEGNGINNVYSTAVWIHFNFFDMYHYLSAIQKLLPAGGKLYFDYADPARISMGGPNSERILSEQLGWYLRSPEQIFTMVKFNGLTSVEFLLNRTGFRLSAVFYDGADTAVLAERI